MKASAAETKCFKGRRAQELTEAHCTARKLLLKKFTHFATDFIFFADEMVFNVASAIKDCENRLTFHQVKANKIKRI